MTRGRGHVRQYVPEEIILHEPQSVVEITHPDNTHNKSTFYIHVLSGNEYCIEIVTTDENNQVIASQATHGSMDRIE